MFSCKLLYSSIGKGRISSNIIPNDKPYYYGTSLMNKKSIHNKCLNSYFKQRIKYIKGK